MKRNSRRAMRFAFLITILCGAVDTIDAAPIEVHVDQIARQERMTGTITLREPVTDRLLGTYKFVTGGLGRGSAPFGTYEIGRFRSDSWIGPRWEVHQVGIDPIDGDSAWDPRLNSMRTWLQLHSMHGFNQGTYGCFGVFGGPEVWDRFREQLNYILTWTPTVRFEFGEPWVIASYWIDRA